MSASVCFVLARPGLRKTATMGPLRVKHSETVRTDSPGPRESFPDCGQPPDATSMPDSGGRMLTSLSQSCRRSTILSQTG
jgi:hypothetical protein